MKVYNLHNNPLLNAIHRTAIGTPSDPNFERKILWNSLHWKFLIYPQIVLKDTEFWYFCQLQNI
jgi:hypothetical protein